MNVREREPTKASQGLRENQNKSVIPPCNAHTCTQHTHVHTLNDTDMQPHTCTQPLIDEDCCLFVVSCHRHNWLFHHFSSDGCCHLTQMVTRLLQQAEDTSEENGSRPTKGQNAKAVHTEKLAKEAE